MKANELQKWVKNPRKITASKARILSKTLRQFGDLSGIVMNKANGQLVGGHMRADALGSAQIEITEKYDKPTAQGTIARGWAILDGEKHAYREVLFDEQTHAAAAIAANKGAGEWDYIALKDLALELDTGAFDLELTGFDLTEMENLLGSFGESKEEQLKKQVIGSTEYSEDEFQNFAHECPKCGFSFNSKK